MTNKIPQTFIDEVLARTDIIDVIQPRVSLQKKGANHHGRCPFHDEKTPSFTASQPKQFYYCFGCGAHGNAIGFLMNYDRVSFLEALEQLASRAGLSMPERSQSSPEYDNYYELLNQANQFFKTQLAQHKPAQEYLKKRGISAEIAKQFGLGFAPSGWDNLKNLLAKSRNIQQDLITCGMLISKENGNAYDRFRDRLMFPIRNIRGKVIAFGGRTLGDDTPKYLNSPETPVFHKSNQLYGLYEARKKNTSLDSLIVVEGYMDVVGLSQHGIHNAVATLGTAVTENHIKLLLKYTTNIVFCFDGDNAGLKAAWRALETALPLMHDGLAVRFLLLDQGEDPDSFVHQHGASQFSEAASDALTLADFFFQQLAQQYLPNDIATRAQFAKAANAYLAKMPNGIFQQLMYQQLATIVYMDADNLQTSLAEPTQENNPRKIQSSKPRFTTISPMRLAITILLQAPTLGADIQDADVFRSMTLPGAALLGELLEVIQSHPGITTTGLMARFDSHAQERQLAKLLASELLIGSENADLAHELLGALQKIRRNHASEAIQSMMKKANNQSLTNSERMQLQDLISQQKLNEEIE